MIALLLNFGVPLRIALPFGMILDILLGLILVKLLS